MRHAFQLRASNATSKLPASRRTSRGVHLSGHQSEQTMASDRLPTPSSFGTELQRHRLAAGLTQEELAERAGLSARGISDLERGVRIYPHRETARLLADALELVDPERQTLLLAGR